MKRSTLIPTLLAVYLIIMAYIGRSRFLGPDRLIYIGLFAFTVVCIVALYFNLRRREHRNRR